MWPTYIYPLWCLLLLPAPAPASLVGRYCGSDTPLSTPYFAPFHKREETALGCQAASPPDAEAQVHVVRLVGDLREVYLDVSGSGPVALVLMSATPTLWHLAATSQPSPSILVSVGSSVIEAATGQELPVSPALLTSPKLAAKIAMGKFGHLNSFTTVAKDTNRVFVSLPEAQDEELDSFCVGPTTQPSKIVRAFMVERQSSYGCYHPEAAGLLPNDVHVIDLRDDQRRLYRRSLGELPEVMVELGPELEDGFKPLSRNLTLVLKSDQPVRWLLKSSGIKGRLLVTAGDNPVEKVEMGETQELEVQQAAIPDQFEGLMEEVTKEYGRPLSYLRVHHANLLEMTIPPRSKRELANLWEDRNQHLETSRQSLTPAKSMDERIYEAAESIESVMEKTCNEERKEMGIAIPATLLTQLGVGAISLNDPTCQAKPEGNIWSVVSHNTKCGSTALIQGSVPMFRNNLNIQFKSGALAGQRTKISFICKFRPCIPGVPCSTDDDDDDDDEEEPEEEDHEEDGEDEMYSMSVRLAGEVEKSLLKRRSDSAPVAIGDDIHVSSHINAVPYLALAMEHCWLSSSPRPTSFAGPRDVKLITSGCPARENVSMQWEEGSSNSAFTFTLSPSLSHHQRLWIQCRMGLCSATSSGANGNILRCIRPEEACGVGAPTHMESALQQVTVRGPLHVIPLPRDQLDPGHAFYGTHDKGKPEDSTHSARPSSRTLVEVPVEVAVAISLASFLVGALSTGVLWFLHSRALRAKSVSSCKCEEWSDLTAQEQLRSVLAGEGGTELQAMLGLAATPGPAAGQQSSSGDQNGNCPSCPLVLS